jgi:hypothetical protein
LQRLPNVATGTNLGISIGAGVDSIGISVGPDGMRISRFEEGTTVFETTYMATEQRCYALGYGDLVGDARTSALVRWDESFRHYLLEADSELFVDDYCQGPEVDQVPLNAVVSISPN